MLNGHQAVPLGKGTTDQPVALDSSLVHVKRFPPLLITIQSSHNSTSDSSLSLIESYRVLNEVLNGLGTQLSPHHLIISDQPST
ncbi:hypothetical protein PGT21_012362 [Puccinia graminis f. sp. tritici]|uniref:Uncharacterized protein n=1 Tax=Puccinia graminis f. sp. tritici TaxID=56615 RepID=A0A5B0NW17_PUCGR|nr:hypothetical protein PGT21_012362 [Puccinia graminis f. sp. tritici]